MEWPWDYFDPCALQYRRSGCTLVMPLCVDLIAEVLEVDARAADHACKIAEEFAEHVSDYISYRQRIDRKRGRGA